ncbi:uncharacterized protein LOC125684399 [Lagopus muta]|uniref:uncharacterized protein LOC125684399 n=1 Tax=Lagopus muta TaxID=64668 RepID=UPI00209CA111|nr:uncharacterized protein LOC125684399 [Lagopus muta]
MTQCQKTNVITATPPVMVLFAPIDSSFLKSHTMLLQQMIPHSLKPVMRFQTSSPGDPEGVAELRTKNVAIDVRKAECPVLSSKNRAARTNIKGGPVPISSIHFSCLLLVGNQVHLQSQVMSCYTQCVPCRPCGPTPLASSCNEPCVRQCQNSTIAIEPSPVVVTLPGPILSSFPQNTVVGSSTSAAVGRILSSEGVPITSGGFDLSGLGSRSCGRRCPPC